VPAVPVDGAAASIGCTGGENKQTKQQGGAGMHEEVVREQGERDTCERECEQQGQEGAERKRDESARKEGVVEVTGEDEGCHC
jgi:hypothetical protein